MADVIPQTVNSALTLHQRLYWQFLVLHVAVHCSRIQPKVDLQVNGQSAVPPLALAEMAFACGHLLCSNDDISLTNVAFGSSISAEQHALQVTADLHQNTASIQSNSSSSKLLQCYTAALLLKVPLLDSTQCFQAIQCDLPNSKTCLPRLPPFYRVDRYQFVGSGLTCLHE